MVTISSGVSEKFSELELDDEGSDHTHEYFFLFRVLNKAFSDVYIIWLFFKTVSFATYKKFQKKKKMVF